MAIRFWLTRPRLALARLKYWAWERANPDRPWWCQGTIAFCEKRISKEMSAIEFGSGRSTRWLSTRVATLMSIEHNSEWYRTVRAELSQSGCDNVDYRFVPLDHPEAQPEEVHYAITPSYVAAADEVPDRSVGLAIVDGHYRTHCVRHLVPKVMRGGYLIVDDTNMWPAIGALPIPSDWSIVDDSTNGIKRCVIWRAT